MTWIAVFVGGGLGSVFRHSVNVAVARLAGGPVFYSTFAVNVIGSFVIGLLAGLTAASRLDVSPTLRVFVFVGVLGGFTTFSSYMLDSLTLVHNGQLPRALANVAGQVVLGYAAAVIGFKLGA
jgi:CrcB protein